MQIPKSFPLSRPTRRESTEAGETKFWKDSAGLCVNVETLLG